MDDGNIDQHDHAEAQGVHQQRQRTGDENLAKAVRTGIQKVNLNTDVSEAGKQALREALASTEVHGSGKDEFTPKKMNLQQTIAAGVAGFQAELEHYMKLFGSENRW